MFTGHRCVFQPFVGRVLPANFLHSFFFLATYSFIATYAHFPTSQTLLLSTRHNVACCSSPYAAAYITIAMLTALTIIVINQFSPFFAFHLLFFFDISGSKNSKLY
jgi:hypothetical protein